MSEIDYSKLDSQLHGIESTPAQEVPVSKRDNTSSAPETNPSVAVKPPQVTAPIAPPVVAQQPNVNDLATQAANTNKTLETSAPAPVAPSPVQAMTGGTSGVAPVAVGALLGASAMMGIHHLIKKSEVNPKDLDKKETVLNKENTGVIPPKQTEGQPQVVGPTESELVSPDQNLNETPVNIETPKGTEENPIVDTRPITKAEEQKAEEIFNSMDELKSVGDIGKEKVEPTVVNEEVKPVEKERGGLSGKPRNNPTKAEREAKKQAELKVIEGANLPPTHHLTREEIANQEMHPEMKKIVEEGNKQIESDPKLKADIEKLKAEHKIPEGFVFIPGMGSQDTHFINSYGFEKYRQAKKELTNGNPLGEYRIQPGSKNYDPEFHKALKKWSEANLPASKIAGIPSMSGKENGLAAPEDTNFFSRMPEELKPRFLKGLGKAGAVGGVALTLADLANARTAAKHGNPEEAQKLLGNALMGIVNPLAGYMGEAQ
jgi:hypothetical protein